MTTPSATILQANLAALAATSPAVARAVAQATPREDLEFAPTDDGLPSASLEIAGTRRLLASARRPLDEGRKLAQTVNLSDAAGVLIPGFGLGYHARALVERLPAPSPRGEENPLPPWGVVVIFEPDVALLRAVLERVDHSAWLRRPDVVLVCEPTLAAVGAAMRGREALPFLGTDAAFLDHPAQRSRLGAAAAEFTASFRAWIGASRTAVMTTLKNVQTTTTNSLANLARYTNAPGVLELRGLCATGGLSGAAAPASADTDGQGSTGRQAARGTKTPRPAIIIAAGPSLRRNLHLLKRPGLRDRFVIIAVQTVLKTLLAEGIRPHFVTALDYHEISRRFYEGLTAADVEGITLVAEPQANAAILEAWPGRLRLLADPFLEELIGEDLTRPLDVLRRNPQRPTEPVRGATVAHMAYYLARYLGCDPAILVGQDLAFTDGQYYGAGAAIHQVWSGELSDFRTLEMFEWERIVRGRFAIDAGQPNLRRATDTLGRSIYTDEQMATYLAQFERDFGEDAGRGLAVIDATEGGIAKRHTVPMPLADAIEGHWECGPTLTLPEPRPADDADARTRRTLDRLRQVRREVAQIATHSRTAAALLREMLDHQSDQSRLNKLIGKAGALGKEVLSLRPAFSLVQHLNQAGSLKRVRADRALMLNGTLSPIERQRCELERDLSNVQWLADAADELGTLLDMSARRMAGKPGGAGVPPVRTGATPASSPAHPRIVAIITADPDRSGLGIRRDLAEPLFAGVSPLRCVLERLSHCRALDGVLIACENPDRIRPLIAGTPPSLKLELAECKLDTDRARAIAAARLFSPHAWRGAPGGLSIYDEACNPATLAPLMEERSIDAAAIVGDDWALVDPALIDAAATAFREGATAADTGAVRLTFCQAPPGLGTAVLAHSLMRELASNAAAAGPLATIGGRLSYSPYVPMPDPIATLRPESNGKPVCITARPALRDGALRFTADAPTNREFLSRTLTALGSNWPTATADQLLSAASGLRAPVPLCLPRDFTLELCTGRLTSGRRAAWLFGHHDPAERPVMSATHADRILRQIGALRPDATVTLYGAGDPLLHAELPRIIAAARCAGIAAVHLRTDLLCDEATIGALLAAAPDVISVDLMAETPATYRTLMGADLFERARRNLSLLLERRAAAPAGGLPTPWIVPRITRCDATYEEIEPFYDRWLAVAGAAVIDPLPAPQPGDRIEPLPVPLTARRADRMVIRSDGTVTAGSALDFTDRRAAADLTQDTLEAAWRKSRTAPAARTGHGERELATVTA